MYMPTYEYACGACGHQWEQVQRIVEAPVEVCPKCAKSSAHRLISGGTNFILKGGGWYSDLYSSAKPAAKSAEGAAGGTTDTPSKAEGATSTESRGPTESKGSTESKKAETKAAPATSTPTTPSSSAPSSSSSAPSSSS
jgi:putative FmdB family regulatory protein